ncbi:MAG TPA: proline iminopeptidase-family hydrolase [Bryobacteraceae bacterium]
MNRRTFLTALGTSSLTQIGCFTWGEASGENRVQHTNGGIRVAGIRMIAVRDGKYKVWTKKVGQGHVKVLLLHGGPGMSHEYLECFESFLPDAGVEFFYYDQLGCNNSDQPNDPEFWTLEGYLKEVEDVRRSLGLESFVLYGHSWGGVLAIEYALRYPQHLRALVISNMAAGMKAYLARINWWRTQLPADVQASLDAFDRTENYSSPAYSELMMKEVYPRAICRLDPWPEPVVRTLRHANEQIYVQMQGPSEFLMTGNLRDWERWEDLPRIPVKTLTIGSRYDEMNPEDMEKMAKLIPGGTYAYCPNGSHLCMWDDQASYFHHLLSFLKAV